MKNITKKKDNGSRKNTENMILSQNEKISILIEKARERVRESENEDYVNELQINRQKETRFRLMVFQMISDSEKLMWP